MTVTHDQRQVDLWDVTLFQDGPPIEIFDRLRAEAPLYWSPHPEDRDGGFWSVTRYADVHALSRDTTRFSSTGGIAVPRRDLGDIGVFAENIMFRDPPAHTKHRRPLNPPFSVKAMNEIQSQIRDIVVGVLDSVEGRGRFDWVPDVAAEIPARVVAQVMGVPEEDHGNIVQWAWDVFGNDGSPEGRARYKAAVESTVAYGAELLGDRRLQPRDDITSLLLAARIDGEPLSDDVLRMWFFTLLSAGFETTHTALAQSLVLLDSMPELRERLASDRQAVNPAVEELLRYITPVNMMARTATEDVELHGQTIRKGQYVCMWYVAANRDPAVFADPHRFDVDRDPNPHQAFGATGSPHYCLGAQLARLEIRILLDELAERGFPYRVDGRPERMGGVFVNALKHLPVARI